MQQWDNKIVYYENVDPNDLLPHELNARIHTEFQESALSDLIDDVGIVQAVIVSDRTKKLLDGHLRTALAIKRGQTVIPAVYVDVTEEEEAKILATYDPLGALAEVDSVKLQALQELFKVESENLQSLLSGFVGGTTFTEEFVPVTIPREAVVEDKEPKNYTPQKQVTISFSAPDYIIFMNAIFVLEKHYGIENTSEILFNVVRDAAAMDVESK